MANGDGYVLNRDFWAPLQANEEGKYYTVGRFSRGDVLTGVELPEEFLKIALSGPNPTLIKKDSKEQERVGAPTVAAASSPSTPEQRENKK
jgi:hypothetical protein